MVSRHLRLIALAAALLHAADSGVTGLSHHHGDAACAHSHAASYAVSHGASCSHHHHHGPAAEALADTGDAPSPSSIPAGDDHDCAACRHLCQPLLHVLVTLETIQADPICELSLAAPARVSSPRIAIYQSRAPPGATV
jgi:hypothetical protein